MCPIAMLDSFFALRYKYIQQTRKITFAIEPSIANPVTGFNSYYSINQMYQVNEKLPV